MTPTKTPMTTATMATIQKRPLISVMLVEAPAAEALAAAPRMEVRAEAVRIASRRAARIAAPYTTVL
jgi:hypothetical protein